MKQKTGNENGKYSPNNLVCIKKEADQVLVCYLPGNTLFLMPECCYNFVQPVTLEWMDDYLPSDGNLPYPVMLNLDGKIYDRTGS